MNCSRARRQRQRTGALPRLCLCALTIATLVFSTTLVSRAAVVSEDFATDPTARGWRAFGDSSLFHWNAANQNLEVTWDSSHTNSFYYLPLGTVLARNDDFSVSFDVRLSDIHIGTTPGKTNTFELAIGLIDYRSAIRSNAFRGAGLSSTYGVRNVVEFDYFMDPTDGDTFTTAVISSNNSFAYFDNFPLTMSVGDLYRIEMDYSASNRVLRTSAHKNGSPFGTLGDVLLPAGFDFRVDSFAVTSYSDAVQAPPAAYNGSVLAHGVVDNVELKLPPPPLGSVALRQTNSSYVADFASSTNWLYTLEGSGELGRWAARSAATRGNGATLSVADTNPVAEKVFYRVRAERP